MFNLNHVKKMNEQTVARMKELKVYGMLRANYEWFLNGNIYSNCSSQFCPCQLDGFYTVVITNGNGCSSSSPLFSATDCAVGMDEFSKNQLIIYPNPANDRIIISQSFKNAKVFNMVGEIIFRIEYKSAANFIDVSELPDGIYFVEIEGDPETISKISIVK